MNPQEQSFIDVQPDNHALNPQIVYSWKAPIRAYKKRSKYVLRFYIAVAILLSVLIFLLGDKILILPIWAVLFLFYVLTITPPPIIENKISKFGIETAGITVRWEALSHFYFTDRFGFPILTLVGSPPFYTHTFLVVTNAEVQKQLIRILAEHLVYQDKPTLNLTDRIIAVLSYLMPEDEDASGVDQSEQQRAQSTRSEIHEVKDTLASFFQKQPQGPPLHPSSAPS